MISIRNDQQKPPVPRVGEAAPGTIHRPPDIPARTIAAAPTERPAGAIERTSRGLCAVLFDELESLRAGDSDHQRATATAKLANQIIAVVKMEMEFAARVGPGSEVKSISSIPLGVAE